MTEAMARALPVVATDVGGVHEILQPDVLVPPKDADALADKISTVWIDTVKLQELSSRNYEFVQHFRLKRLQHLRKTWFQ